MLKETVIYKQWVIEKHVGGARPVYRAFLNGVKVGADTSLAWLKKDLTQKST
jgi:hypothetical protein